MVQTSEKSFVLEIFLRLLKKESVRRNCQKCENSQANPNLLEKVSDTNVEISAPFNNIFCWWNLGRGKPLACAAAFKINCLKRPEEL